MKGVVMQEVRDALVGAFNQDSLTEMLRFRLDRDLFSVVPPGALNTVAFNLLRLAEQEGFEYELIEAAYQYRPKNARIREVYEKYALAPKVTVADKPTDLEGLEKVVRAGVPMLDMGLFWERASRVEARVCRVEISGSAAGTGFLVGPDALLTNYHVLRKVIENKAAPGDVSLRFGYKRAADDSILSGTVFKLAADWLIDFSPHTIGEGKGTPEAAAPKSDELDYTLVRVAGEPGKQKVDRQTGPEAPPRGWVEVPASVPVVGKDQPLLIVQHPQGEPLKLAVDMQSTLGENADRTRLRYRTNTEPGSSGSPCFDCEWRLVALHHYGDPAYDHPKFNQGVPAATIRKLLETRGKAGSLGGPSA